MLNVNLNPNLKLIRKLSLKKYRDKFGLFLLEGDKFIADAPSHLIHSIVRASDLPNSLFSSLSSLSSPQSLIAICKKPPSLPLPNNLPLLPVLDRIQDPSNLGAILRSISARGLKHVIIISGSADPFSLKAVRSSASSIFLLNLIFMDIPQLLSYNFNLVSSHIHGSDFRSFSLPPRCALVFGNEGHGVHPDILSHSSHISIPISNVESLNAACAASILLFHF